MMIPTMNATMNATSELIKLHNDTTMEATLLNAGFINLNKIADTLQGNHHHKLLFILFRN